MALAVGNANQTLVVLPVPKEVCDLSDVTLIRTNEFSLTRREYFNVIAAQWWRKRWWLYLVLLLLGVTLVWLRPTVPALMLILFSIVTPVATLVYFWLYSGWHDNRLIFIRRRFELDEAFLTAHLEDGSMSRLRWENVVRATRVGGFWLLYLFKDQCIIVPESVLTSDEDRQKFDGILRMYDLV